MAGFFKKEVKKLRNALLAGNDLRRGLARVSYAREGEDLVLLSFFKHLKKGFYVDVGAHHTKRFSNTYLLYRRGWSGINIDPAPGTKSLFAKARPRDTTLEIGIAIESGMRDFFMFDNSPLNTFDASLAEERQLEGWKLLEKRAIEVQPLAAVLRDHCGMPVNLLTIDTEGLDLEVL